MNTVSDMINELQTQLTKQKQTLSTRDGNSAQHTVRNGNDTISILLDQGGLFEHLHGNYTADANAEGPYIEDTTAPDKLKKLFQHIVQQETQLTNLKHSLSKIHLHQARIRAVNEFRAQFGFDTIEYPDLAAKVSSSELYGLTLRKKLELMPSHPESMPQAVADIILNYFYMTNSEMEIETME